VDWQFAYADRAIAHGNSASCGQTLFDLGQNLTQSLRHNIISIGLESGDSER